MKNWRISSIRRMVSERTAVLLLLTLLTLAAAALSLGLGAVPVPPADVLRGLFGMGENAAIIRHVRLPRTCGALLAGMSLAVSEAVIQSVLANPLAAPNIIGVNAGAGLMTALCCAVAPTAMAITPIAAFLGALAGVMLVLFLAERTGAARITLVLAGCPICPWTGSSPPFGWHWLPSF